MYKHKKGLAHLKECILATVLTSMMVTGCVASNKIDKNSHELAQIEEMTLAESKKGSLAAGSAQNGVKCPTSFFLADLQFLDPDQTIDMLKKCKVETISVPLVWSFLEKNEGDYDAKEYDELLKPYLDAGFRFIFLLDVGGREIVDDNGELVAYSLPDWVRNGETLTRHVDLLGEAANVYGLSYSNPTNAEALIRFIDKTTSHFGEKYEQSLVGFAPCITNEFEVKYPQTKYAFTDYSNEALDGFHHYLIQKYNSIDELNDNLRTDYSDIEDIELPTINYSNSISSGELNDDPLFMDFMKYREQVLVDYLIPVYSSIRDKGYKAIAYFGQTLSSHDAIYAAGVATRLSDFVDIAVIDYNFYNGYNEVYESIIPAMMVNYMHNAGYKEVWAGLYFERIPYAEHMDFLQETIDYIAADGLAKGYEIGGLLYELRDKGDAAVPTMTYGVTVRTEQPRIAMYAGKWNFYKDHGESVRYFDYFSDVISQMYKIIRFELEYQVDILGDEAILNNKLQDYDLLVLPSQFFVDADVKNKIEEYLANGGKAFMDFRFGEWNASGDNTGSWSDDYFCIGGKESAKIAETTLSIADNGLHFRNMKEIRIHSFYPDVPNIYYLCSSDKNKAKALFKNKEGKEIGVFSDNTVVLGFQPQVQYKYTESKDEQKDNVEIIEGVIKYLLD